MVLAEYLQVNKLKLNYRETIEPFPGGVADQMTRNIFDLML